MQELQEQIISPLELGFPGEYGHYTLHTDVCDREINVGSYKSKATISTEELCIGLNF